MMYQTREDECGREAYGEAWAARGAFMQAMRKCLLYEGFSSHADARCNAAFQINIIAGDELRWAHSDKLKRRGRRAVDDGWMVEDGREVKPARRKNMVTETWTRRA